MWKYIGRHIRNHIKTEKVIFVLMVCCVLSSVITLCFSFGFYHHLQQKKQDAEVGVNELFIHSVDEERKTVNKKAYTEALLSLDDRVWDNLDLIAFEGRFIEEVTDSPPIDNSLLVEYLPFKIEDGKMAPINLKERWTKGGLWADGEYFTEEQFEKGELFCITPEEWVYDAFSGEQAEWVRKFMPTKNGTFVVGGKEYQCIGHFSGMWFSMEPMVPITTVKDDCYIKDAVISFKKPITRYQYESIKMVLTRYFGDYVEIPELNLPDSDSMKFYNTLLILCVVMAIFSGIVLAFLYQYVFMQRKHMLTIYRLCGLSLLRIRIIYFLECMIIIGGLYLLGVLVFHVGILPYFSRIFEYMAASYGLYSYGVLGILYVGISSFILLILIMFQTKDNIVQELKGI